MNRKEVIALAQEVGFVAYGEDAGEYRIPTPAFHGRLERFAELVAATEREACAKVCEEMWTGYGDLGAICASAIRARGNDVA